MSRARVALVLLALASIVSLGSCGPRDLQAPAALLGRWEGHVAWRDATTPIGLVIEPRGDSLAARFMAPAVGESIAAGGLAFDSPHVRFSVPDSAGPIAFDGWLRRGLIVGAFSSPMLGESNRGLMPQVSLRRIEAPTHPSPWPESLRVVPVTPREPERSFGAWLRARAAR